MGNNFKFRSALKTDKHSIIIPIENINRQGYTININVAEDVFEKKYPGECFWDFIEEIQRQPHIQEISEDCDLIFVDGFKNLMQSTGIFDATKFKDLTPLLKQEWLKNNKPEDWHGIEIFEGDVAEIKYRKDVFEYGVVHYSIDGAGYSKGSVSVGSYKKQTKVVGNIYEGWPANADYMVDFYFRNCSILGDNLGGNLGGNDE